jgi:FkbM family methyltransferase
LISLDKQRGPADGTDALPEEVVRLFYRQLLGREPDEAGLSHYVAALTEGRLSVAEIYANFVNSEEYETRAGIRNVFRDLVPIPYLGCQFMISKWSVVAREIAAPEGYEPWVLPYFLDMCREGMTVLDVGASWGVYSLPAAKRVGPKGRVLAVEVSPQNCRILLHNVRINALDNVEILAIGASDRVGTARMTIQTHGNTNSIDRITSDDDPFFGGFDVVPTLPLDLLSAHIGRVDILKMDIDGADYRACVGARELLTIGRPIVFLEYCPMLLRPLSGIDPGELLKLFLELDYDIEVLHRVGPRERIAGGSWDDMISQVDRLCDEHVRRDHGTHLDLCMHPKVAKGST